MCVSVREKESTQAQQAGGSGCGAMGVCLSVCLSVSMRQVAAVAAAARRDKGDQQRQAGRQAGGKRIMPVFFYVTVCVSLFLTGWA